MNKHIEIYTDGSSLGNPGPGGWGTVVVINGKIVEELGGHDKDTTNNRMELQAAIEALKYINKKHKDDHVTI
ncbi:ribonuclease HI, partial [Candidatus Nomurabacteria bacterium]|nr:ribonuclease HI [Candidatus Nomurabacteria bacterium]